MSADGEEAVSGKGLEVGVAVHTWPPGALDRTVVPLRPLDANDMVRGVFATVRRYL
ncbi:hypothetical protein [Streptomyces sp. 8L]|uniref:hypothetical protein n=1 Tax=Streptomyces sp. 8L TaxID=2877242 RepID=UPI001CD808B6|nr:hypothetical protein [Streptomyces sp. 8L]MCA1222945.1 hypothetical protein [Streptomyces sp. 8L]